MANYLHFLTIDLNGANQMDFEELKNSKNETFCVTQEMLDDCDISGSVTLDSILVRKIEPNSETQNLSNAKIVPSQDNATGEANGERKFLIKPDIISRNETKFDSNTANSDSNQRCEDTIFGELVVAMLKKMSAEDKKRAKKEIMNIML